MATSYWAIVDNLQFNRTFVKNCVSEQDIEFLYEWSDKMTAKHIQEYFMTYFDSHDYDKRLFKRHSPRIIIPSKYQNELKNCDKEIGCMCNIYYLKFSGTQYLVEHTYFDRYESENIHILLVSKVQK